MNLYPIINMTPESTDAGHNRWGEDVTRNAFALIRREAPASATESLENNRAFVVNIFGDDLDRRDVWLAKYAEGGNVPAWHFTWRHPGAGRVETYVYEVGEGKTAQQVVAEKLGWRNA